MEVGKGKLVMCRVDRGKLFIAFKTEKGDIYKIENMLSQSIREGRPTKSFVEFGARPEEMRHIEREPDVIEVEATLDFQQTIQTYIDADIVEERTVLLLEPGEPPTLTCGVGWPD